MIVYLAAFETLKRYYEKPIDDVYFLSSFFEHKGKRGEIDDYICGDKHILDSGAYSTFKNVDQAKKMDWDDYVNKYISFIKKTGQRLFFELDIDAIVGLDKVEYYRKKIEDAIGIQPIPVWHASRKWDYFEYMCENYPYVSLGTTMANKQGKLIRKNPNVLQQFIHTAHKNGCKIHGLGFTDTSLLHELKFDSVDSTTWISGARYGQIYQFDGTKMVHITPPKGMRATDHKIVNTRNFEEWVKFQRYALQNL